MRKPNAEKFGIVKKRNVSVGRINLTLCPRRLNRIKGDRNCFFRTVSFIITGNEYENDHEDEH